MEEEQRTVVYGRYTDFDGFRGWVQARSMAALLYGDGVMELRGQDLLVRGWRRSWLGVAERVELVIPLDAINDAAVDGRGVRFVWTRRGGLSRQIRFHAESNEDALRLFSWLPAVRSDRFERWAALSALNDRVAAVGNQPWVTAALVVLNLVMFIAWFSTQYILSPLAGFELQSLGSNYGPAVLNGEWWRLVSSLFLHASVAHVLVNMWVLWNVGRLCERLYGSGPFALLYLGSGALACIARIAWDPTVASIGASGAIFGVIGAFLAFAWRSHQQILVTVPRSTWLSTAVFAAYSLITGWLNPVVDNAAHVGGLIGGIVLGWILTRPLDVDARSSPPVARSTVAVALVVCSAVGIWWHAGGARDSTTAIERYFHNHKWYVTAEANNLKAWGELETKQAAGALRNHELALGYEQQVLPFWNRTAERLRAEQPALPPDQRAAHALMMQLVSLRQQWVRASIAAARNPSDRDPGALAKFSLDVDRTSARLERLNLLAQASHRRGSLAHSPLVNSIASLLGAKQPACVGVLTGLSGTDDPGSDGPQAIHAAGCRAQSLFLSGRYRELDDFINTSSRSIGDLPDGESTLAGIFSGLRRLFESDPAQLVADLGRTSDWRYAVPRSINPMLVESMLFDMSAWSVRGHGGADSVSAQAWRLFAYRVEMASASLDEIQARAKTNPVWYEQALDIGLDQSHTVAQLREVFDRGVAIAPAYGPLYRQMLRILMPRWLGSPEDIAGFIETVTDKPIEPDFILYARLYWTYSTLEDDRVGVFDEGLGHWAIVQTGFDRLIEQYPKSDYILNAYAKFACIAKDEEQYQKLRPKLKGRFSTPAWSDAVSLKSCDARFEPDVAEPVKKSPASPPTTSATPASPH